METKHVNTGEALRFGWSAFKEKAGFLLLVMFVSSICILVPYGLSLAVISRSLLLGSLCMLIYYVVAFVISIGYMTIALKIVDGQQPELRDLWSHTQELGRFAAGVLLYMLIVMGGLLLCIVPGIIWAFKYYFTPYLLVDKNMKPMEALRASAQMTDGIKFDLFKLLFVVGLVAMLGYLFLFVGIFVTIPIAILAIAYTYRSLDKQVHGGASTPTIPTTPEILE